MSNDFLSQILGSALGGNSGSAGPTEACRGRVLHLSGMTGSLAMSARSTLRGGLDAPWAEVREASRTIRAVAREASRIARAPGWASTCGALPPLPENDRATAHKAI